MANLDIKDPSQVKELNQSFQKSIKSAVGAGRIISLVTQSRNLATHVEKPHVKKGIKNMKALQAEIAKQLKSTRGAANKRFKELKINKKM